LKYLLNDMLLPFGCLISCWLICSLCSPVVDGDVVMCRLGFSSISQPAYLRPLSISALVGLFRI